MKIDQLIKGNKKFREVHFPNTEEDFENLVKHGQKPEILFIGCSDSRVVPDLIVDSNPGDMFILRNIGNFVPPYKSDNDFHGSSAAIEYAVSVLNVKDIIVCGHSHCGACAALYQDLSDEPHLQHVRKWLELGHKAKEYTLLAHGSNSPKELLQQTTEKISIKHQLENLLSYPEIYRKVNEGELDIHGWYYKIEDGSIEYYDGQTCSFQDFKHSS
ncbi:MAG: carbonic anhydrase [Campylobacterota bacterium]|nr:carbonic anhydrase [Campylobacterota bacterium]